MSPTEQRPSGAPGLSWRYLAHCEVGLVRKNNQDSGLANSAMLAVADGMGGAAAGDLASAIAVDTLTSVAAADHQPLASVSQALRSANERIADLIANDTKLDGMGTTATVAVLDGDQIRLAHIGDSRAYLFRDGHLEQLTHDHSWVQSLIDDGKISEAQAQVHPHRSLLLRVINGQATSEPDLASWPCRAGDRLMVCSDGLCGFVTDERIAAALAQTDRQEAMARLVDAAHQAGGLDNITIILADVAEPEPAGPGGHNTSHPTDTSGRDRSPHSTQQAAGPAEQTHIMGAAADHRVVALESKILRGADKDIDADDVDKTGQADKTGETDKTGRVDATGEDSSDDHAGEDVASDGEEGPADEDRYAPQPPRRRRLYRGLVVLSAVVLVVAAAAVAGFAWTRTQYYVGADDNQVAIYQGLHKTLPGIPLSRVYRVQSLRTSDLPAYYQKMVHSTINADSLSSAQATVHQLRDVAEHCRVRPPGSAKSDQRAAAETSKSPPGKHKPSGSHRPSGKHKSAGKHPKHSPHTDKSAHQHKPAVPSAAPSPIRSGPLPGKGRC